MGVQPPVGNVFARSVELQHHMEPELAAQLYKAPQIAAWMTVAVEIAYVRAYDMPGPRNRYDDGVSAKLACSRQKKFPIVACIRLIHELCRQQRMAHNVLIHL